MKISNKKTKISGITIISLIITVIVLIILAGITLSLLLGENGILNCTAKSVEETKKNSAKEQIQLEVLECKIAKGAYETEYIKNNILTHIENSVVSGTAFPLVAVVDSYIFKIDENGNVVAANYDYLVEFNGNGVAGTMNVQEFSFGESKKLKANQYSQAGFTFLNWNTKADGSGTSYKNEASVSNLTLETNGVITLYAQWMQSPAQINGVYYDTVQKAIAKAPNGVETTIQITKDTNENITIKSGQNIIFDLNGKTLNSQKNDAVITNNGTLTITQGAVESTYATGTINNNQGGTLIIDGAKITGKLRSAVYNDKGTVIIKGDSYLSSSATGNATNQPLERGAVHNLSGGNIIITGGTIVGIKQQAITNMGTMRIGTEGDIDTTSPIIIGNTFGIKNNATLEFYDGIVKGIEGVISGNPTTQEPNTKWINGTEVIDGKTYKTGYLEYIE